MEAVGLTSKEALVKLCGDIELTLNQFKESAKSRGQKSYIWDSLHHLSQHTSFCWIPLSCLVWISISLFITYSVEGATSVIYQALVLILLSILNFAVELRNNHSRHNEIPMKITALVQKIKDEVNRVVWLPECYPNLYSPYSPCITLQWTYRDGHLVNLPWSLLVKGDIILVKPGQVSPGYCEAVEEDNPFHFLHSKQVFTPSEKQEPEILVAPKIRKPFEYKKYRLLETPYLNNLVTYLDQALDRPVTQYNQQRHFVMRRVVESSVLPFIFVISYVLSIVRCFYFEKNCSATWILMWPASVITPLMPLTSLIWIILNYYGIARLKTVFNTMRNGELENATKDDIYYTELNKYSKLGYSSKEVFKNFVGLLKGDSDIIFRTTNILHVLGSATALCCIDKKGVLSWPNPTAEKIFFMHNNERSENVGDDNIANMENVSMNSHIFHGECSNSVTAEVLDLTHNHNDPFKLHFDDPSWHKYLPSLKPLGLAILLNTCNVGTQEYYAAFCSHISCEAMCNEILVPVTNRRCLCELAKEIGFVDDAQKIFSLEQQLCTYRHLQSDMTKRDKLAKSWLLPTKLKFPFPHMFAVVVKELSTGCTQLFSEGTADILLDLCVDYWDGHDLRPLTNSERKKIQDFYQRCSLTAYCTAFAYRPLNNCLNKKLTNIYLELPYSSQHIFLNHTSPVFVQWDCKPVLDPETNTFKGHFTSTGSFPCNEGLPIEAVDGETCFQIQSSQIFIGMVTMQYQPLPDMVHLIEQLEGACIRFVHFSKENELRSRVFSEKMGLESGWNCHISLMDEKDGNMENSRKMSFSAPSTVSFDHSLGRFDRILEKGNKDSSLMCEITQDKLIDENIHLDAGSVTHDWQSLSCLTDSTEQSAPINFDMSNRAKLPRGIAEIRPHIEAVDNVPLLVSLFTDCTPDTIREMLIIMQDYKEIVCVMGSSANCENAGIFMQADSSIAVEPLYPQMCQKNRVFERKNGLTPTDIASELNAIPCSLYFSREDPVSVHNLIVESRHYMKLLWNSVQFWLCCCITLTILQITVLILMLPPLLTFGQVLWFCCLIIPFLSVSLMGTPIDMNIMKKPQRRNQNVFNIDVLVFIGWCYGIKFITAVISVLGVYMGILIHHCKKYCALHNCICLMYHTPFFETSNIGALYDFTLVLEFAKLISLVIIFLNFTMLSIGFIHREHLVFQRGPHRNIIWIGTMLCLCFLQVLYMVISFGAIKINSNDDEVLEVPVWVFIFTVLSPLFVGLISEIAKYHEIKVNERFQKRARLDFGTKLGMNSPF